MTGLNSTAARSGVTGILSQILSLTEGLSATPLSHGFWTCDTALFKIFSEPFSSALPAKRGHRRGVDHAHRVGDLK